MEQWLFLTNNPRILEHSERLPVQAVEETGLAAVLKAALELVQSGYRLISTPLPPNVPLIRAPYRTLILKRGTRRYDAAGIMALEKAGPTAAKLGTAAWTETQALDSAYIDQDIFRRSLRECGCPLTINQVTTTPA